MGLFSFIIGLSDAISESEKDKKSKKLEREMEWNRLDEFEKKEVRKGNYEVHNFEDSSGVELDEDDYYFEDRR